jgi:ketosteroid isomerase-like protein
MDLESERRRLLERDAQWAAISAQGRDVERILSFWTDDARVYPPGMPPVSGKAALRIYVQGALAIPGFHITWASSEADLSPDGQMAYLLGINEVTMPAPGGQAVTSRGRALTVWRRDRMANGGARSTSGMTGRLSRETRLMPIDPGDEASGLRVAQVHVPHLGRLQRLL